MSKYVKREIVSSEMEDDGFLERVHEHVTYSLKRCPYCGSVAKIVPVDVDEEGDFMQAECPNCGVHTRVSESYEELTELWNERTPEEESSGRIKRCPFCGGQAVGKYDEDIPADEPDAIFIVCTDCGASTRNYLTGKEALNKWNARV